VYYVNGTTMTNAQVKAMFKSIGLNIDNPETFYVGQGKIARLVNFRPEDLRIMLEEAAGIAFYNEISKKSMVMIDRNLELQNENERRINDNLGPTLLRLKHQMEISNQYSELQRVKEEKEKERDSLYYAYYSHILNNESIQLRNTRNMLIELSNKQKHLETEKEKLLMRAREMGLHFDSKDQDELDAHITRILNLEDKLSHLAKTSSDIQLELENKSSSISSYRKIQAEAITKESVYHSEFESISEEMESLSKTKEVLKREKRDIRSAIDSISNKLQSKDITSNANQYFEAKIFKIEDDIRFGNEIVKQKSEEIERLREKVENTEKSRIEKKERRVALNDQIEVLSREISKLAGIDAKIYDIKNSKIPLINNQKAIMLKELQGLRKESRELGRPYQDEFKVKYIKPFESFDTKAVLGISIDHLKIAPEFWKSIEASLGKSLKNIVVTTNDVATTLISGKCFLENQRRDIIPLNKIQARMADQDSIRLAKEIGSMNRCSVWYAREIVQTSSSQFDPLADFLFGNFFIVEDIRIANEIAFHKKINCRVVTLDGDIVDPQGFVSGGFHKNDTFNLFERHLSYKEFEPKIENAENKLSQLDNQLLREQDALKGLEALQHRSAKLEKKLSEARKELSECSDEISEQEKNRCKTKILNEEQKLYETKKKLQQTKSDLEATKKRKDSKSQKQSIQSLKEEKTKLEEEFKTIEVELKQTSRSLSAKESYLEELSGSRQRTLREIEEYKKKIEMAEDYLKQKSLLMKELQHDIDQKTNELKDEVFKKDSLESKITGEKEKLDLIQDELKNGQENIDSLYVEKESLIKSIETHESKLQELSDKVKADKLKIINSASRNKSVIGEIEILTKEINKLESRLEILRPKVNANAKNKEERIAEKISEINEKKSLIRKDESVIREDILNMNTISVNSYTTCFNEVGRSLTDMFEKLLPGATARMIEVITDKGNPGIEIKIAFNGKWKESLTELSGGQRSLLALSLLLSMLKYRSAPFYILDEIDAAMDLSHTENIGSIINNSFPMSQFIVISLKKQMYSCSNVLYKTQLLEGHSTIQRIRLAKNGIKDIRHS